MKHHILVGFQYVPPELFSYFMSHLCCMATTFPTDASLSPVVPAGKHDGNIVLVYSEQK